jgi:hypothetical protein
MSALPMRRMHVALEAMVIVAAIVTAKLVVGVTGLDFITLSPLFTSFVAGGIFVIGLLVAGTLADYKEAEKMPAEIAAALENIHEDGAAIKATKKRFDLDGLQQGLAQVVTALREDLSDRTEDERTCLDAINALSSSFAEMEKLEVPPNYIVRLRSEQGIVRKTVLRMYHIQRTAFLPSAYFLIQSMVGLILTALVFTRLEPLHESIVILVVITYFFVYLLKLLGILDKPFRIRERSMDDVSLFLLHEFADRVKGGPRV